MIQRLALFWLFTVPALVAAQDLRGSRVCDFVNGECVPRNTILGGLPALSDLVLAWAGGAAVLFVIVGGARMLLSFGDDAQITKGRTGVITALVGLALVLGAQVLVSFVGLNVATVAGDSSDPVLSTIGVVIDRGLSLLNIVVVFAIVVAGFRMIFAAGQEDQFTKTRTMLIYIVVGTVIINLAASLVRAVLSLGL